MGGGLQTTLSQSSTLETFAREPRDFAKLAGGTSGDLVRGKNFGQTLFVETRVGKTRFLMRGGIVRVPLAGYPKEGYRSCIT